MTIWIMGLNELVLKVPASEARPPAGHQPSASVAGSSSNSNATTKSSLKTKKSAVKTHSRESSGASNVSVKFSVNDETVTTTRNPRSSDEDITMSDRLSQDLEEERSEGTRLNSSHGQISYAVFCLKKKKKKKNKKKKQTKKKHKKNIRESQAKSRRKLQCY